jgi:hypothetical protein
MYRQPPLHTMTVPSYKPTKEIVLLALLVLVALQVLQGTSKGGSNSAFNTAWGYSMSPEQPCALAPSNETNASFSPVPQIHTLQPPSESSGKSRNLVVFTALGTVSAIGTVHHNLLSHFLDWDCIVFMHAEESAISSTEPRLVEIANHCSIVRLPGMMWSHFLLTLTPELTRGYQHVAVVLDDLFAPSQGENYVNVTSLLQSMQDHNLSSISPAIKGSVWTSTQPRRKRCLWKVHHTETFLQIFTVPLFQCWRSFMKYSNPQGFCLDLCLEQQLCPTIADNAMAVDSSQVAYHLGRQYMVNRYVPKSNLVGTNLSYGMRRDFPKGDYEIFEICTEHNCPSPSNESQIQNPEVMVCVPPPQKP